MLKITANAVPTVFCGTLLCFVQSCYALLCSALLSSTLLCCDLLCCAVLYCAVLCFALLNSARFLSALRCPKLQSQMICHSEMICNDLGTHLIVEFACCLLAALGYSWLLLASPSSSCLLLLLLSFPILPYSAASLLQAEIASES